MQFWRLATDTPAVYDARGRRWRSRGDLQVEAERLGELLPPSKSLVFCFCRNDLASLEWYLACLRYRHAVALLDANLAPDLQQKLVEHYQPDCIVASSALPAASGRHYENAGRHLWWRRRPQDGVLHPSLALLLSTSGSTGSPKFVRLTAAKLAATRNTAAAWAAA